MINKNKEEIEKILKGCGVWSQGEVKGLTVQMQCGNDGFKDQIGLCEICRTKLQERIKTSILWCEDEIEKFEHIFGWLAVCNKNQDILRVADIIKKNIKALQTHLTWLKEQEIKQ